MLINKYSLLYEILDLNELWVLILTKVSIFIGDKNINVLKESLTFDVQLNTLIMNLPVNTDSQSS